MRPTASGDRRGASRRQFLLGGAAAGVGAVAGLGVGLAIDPAPLAAAAPPPLHGTDTVAFFGRHQAGIATTPQAHATFVALDLRPETDRDGLVRLMRILTDDAARLTQGTPALADTEPELAHAPARLTVTFGFGPAFVARAGGTAPAWLAPLPAFTKDRLDPAYGDGDLLLQVAADDPLTVAHTVRMLLKDARSFTTVRWVQQGFRRARGSEASGTTMRNLFGQVDGTSNPKPGSDDFADVVWSRDGWLRDGTGFVLRRIHMDLDSWDRIDRVGREFAVGRRLDTGAPLTGKAEHDEPDLEVLTPLGFPVISEVSHLRRTRSDDPQQRIFRRAYNYDNAPTGAGVSDSGLLFASFQADVAAQFTPIQQRMDTVDLLNEWITAVGSAVFAIPSGCAEGGYIGETLLS